EALSPTLHTGPSIRQLCANPNTAVGAANASLQDVTGTKLTPNLPDVDRPLLVLKARIASDDEQLGKPRQLDRDVLHDPIAEVILVALATEVRERQDGDGWLPCRCDRPGALCLPARLPQRHRPDKSDTLLRQRLNQTLAPTVVADRRAHSVDSAAQRRL